jgi:dephospho-CoA kinase
MLAVGLTGGIASGKSRVLGRLATRGLQTLDLDRVAHDLMAPGGAAYADVVAAFGPGILGDGGAIDRQALGARVFADPAARSRLNALVHPRVRDAEGTWRAGLPEGPGEVAVVDAALLVEAGLHLRFDRLVVAHCGEAEQLRRLMARDGLAEDAARARLRAQMPAERKRRFADLEVDTSGRPEDTDAAADALADELVRLARAPRGTVRLPADGARGALVHGPSEGARGLDALRVIAECTAAGAVDLPALARGLVPPAEGPWYDAARPGEAAGPEAVSLGGVLWCLSARPPDRPFATAVAASLATLTHGGGAPVADACLFARLLQEALVEPQALGGAGHIPEAWVREATRRGGAPPSGRLDAAWRAAHRHPGDPERARAACREQGGDPGLAGALVGAVAGAAAAPAPIEDALRTLSASRR